ncbi:hypothetical protein QEN19_000890 [Hanseniaspora menglaensis]
MKEVIDIVSVSMSDDNMVSNNEINASIYGDDDSLLPPSSTLDEDDLSDFSELKSEEKYDNNSLKIIYSNDDHVNGEDTTHESSAIINRQESSYNPKLIIYEEYKIACQQGNLEKVKELIESKAIDYLNDSDPVLNDNVTGLHWASINNRLSIVKYLAKLPGYNTAAISNDVSKTTALHWAAKYGYAYIVKELIACGADSSLADSQGLNLLHLTTLSSNILTVIYVLLHCPEIDINAQDNDGRTAIMWACYQGDNLTVNTFLKLADKENGLSLNLKDKTGFNCLHWAIVKGNVDVISMIVKKIESSIKSYLLEEIEMDSDIKNCYIIAKEMNTESALKAALLKNGYDYDGNTLVSKSLIGSFFEINHISSTMRGNLFLFFFILPFMQLGIFNKLGDIANPVILFVFIQPLVLAAFGFIYLKLLLPLYVSNPGVSIKQQVNKLMNSTPLFSGILWATIFWGIYIHITRITYYGYANLDFFYFIRSAIVIYWMLPFLLYKLMFVIDPGCAVLDDSRESIKHDVNSLMNEGQYNLKHFEVNTLRKNILRSRFVFRSQKLMHKFDHFCIWIYNDVAANNHKFFVYFLIALIYAVSLIVEGTVGYFDYLEDNYKYKDCFLIGDDKLCAGFQKDSFMLYNVAWMLMQGVWVSLLLLTQLYMVSKGFTTNEFESFKKKFGNKCSHKHGSKDCSDSHESGKDIEDESAFLSQKTNEDEIENIDNSNYVITMSEYRDFDTAPRDWYKRSEIYGNDKNYQAEKLISRKHQIFLQKLHSKNESQYIKGNKFVKKYPILAKIVYSTGYLNIRKFLFTIYYSFNGSTTKLSLYDYGILQNFKDFFLNTDLKAPIWTRIISENLKTNEVLINGRIIDLDLFYEISDDLKDNRLIIEDEDELYLEQETV